MVGRRRYRQRFARFAWLSATAALWTPPAYAADVKQCIEDHAQGQLEHHDGRLRAAHARFLACSVEACPAAIRKECAGWLADVDASQPTVIIDARDPAGAATIAVRTFVDGVLLSTSADGRAVSVDPGLHTFRFELLSDRRSLEQTVLLHEGEQRHPLTVDFSVGRAPEKAASTKTIAPPPSHPEADRRGVPGLTWVFAGGAALGIGAFALFAGLGKSREHDLASTCAPHCAHGDVQSVRTEYVFADLSLGVAALCLGASVVLAWPRAGQAIARARSAVGF
jgi:hypothetical protein